MTAPSRPIRKQITKRCHWVSQSYLRSFAADAAGQKIWRFSKNEGDPELKLIEKAAVRFHLYSPQGANGSRDDRVERKLGELEQWFGHPIWKQLCTSQVDLTWEPLRKMLALIVATTYVRNPAQFDRWKRIHRHMIDVVSRFESMPTHIRIAGVDRKVDPSDWPEFRDANEEQMKAAWNDYVAAAGDIAPALLKMRMVMLAADEPVFVTSDNPVTITHPSLDFRGLRDPESTISFPISPTRMLIMDNRHSEPNGVYYSLADGSAAPQNLLVWRNAIEHMFSHRHTDEVCAELLNAEDRLLRAR